MMEVIEFAGGCLRVKHRRFLRLALCVYEFCVSIWNVVALLLAASESHESGVAAVLYVFACLGAIPALAAVVSFGFVISRWADENTEDLPQALDCCSTLYMACLTKACLS